MDTSWTDPREFMDFVMVKGKDGKHHKHYFYRGSRHHCNYGNCPARIPTVPATNDRLHTSGSSNAGDKQAGQGEQ